MSGKIVHKVRTRGVDDFFAQLQARISHSLQQVRFAKPRWTIDKYGVVKFAELVFVRYGFAGCKGVLIRIPNDKVFKGL